MKSRIGKTNSIFKKTDASLTPRVMSPGAIIRQPAGPSIENKPTIIFLQVKVNFPDRLGLEIMTKTKPKINRTEINRALFDGFMVFGLNLSDLYS